MEILASWLPKFKLRIVSANNIYVCALMHWPACYQIYISLFISQGLNCIECYTYLQNV